MSSALRRNCVIDVGLETAGLKLPIFNSASYSRGLGKRRLQQVDAWTVANCGQHRIGAARPLLGRIDTDVYRSTQLGLSGIEQRRHVEQRDVPDDGEVDITFAA